MFVCTQDKDKKLQDWTTVYFMKTKDEVDGFIDKYAAEHEDLGGYFILVTDNGGEYTGKSVDETCVHRNIRQEFINPYTPEEMAIVERRWRTDWDMAKAMLQYADLPFELLGACDGHRGIRT